MGEGGVTKVDALNIIIEDARSEDVTATSFKRVYRALRLLGFDGEDMGQALWHMSYADAQGNPLPWTRATRRW